MLVFSLLQQPLGILSQPMGRDGADGGFQLCLGGSMDRDL